MSNPRPISATAHKAHKPLTGLVHVPGDKSISHRALILSALATGTSHISGLLESDDILATASALRALGADIKKTGHKWVVEGVGPAGLQNPTAPLDFGNSGTGARLVMGVVAGGGISAHFMGDKSLSARPMARITTPLAQMGAQIEAYQQEIEPQSDKKSDKETHLPLMVRGAPMPLPIDYTPPMASAQVKSAILLAGLGAHGKTIVRETHQTRNHSENMLALFGADIRTYEKMGNQIVELTGPARLQACTLHIPNDPSSAAFPMVAALLVPDSNIILKDILLNPHRDGLIRILRAMGADIRIFNEHHKSGETLADINVCYSRLRGIEVAADKTASMIDEYPLLAVAAAVADGTTRMHGLAELRHKESDRLAAIADGLEKNGVQVQQGEDFLHVTGGAVTGGNMVQAHHDHRIAMAFLVLGLAAQKPIKIDDTRMIATSFPNFFEVMAQMGANFDH